MLPRSVALQSYAKINLDLRVLHKRPDGFHELRTIFQTVSLADTIEIEYTPARTTRIALQSTTDIPNNLILRAAELVFKKSRACGNLNFQLTKRIPLGGGLGGGSSNAASVLLALPVLTGKPLPLADLLELASELGSDVSFFLFGGTAAGLGRGTELYPVATPEATLALLVTPGVHVSTAAAYQGLARPLTGNPSSRIINSFQSLAWRFGDGGMGRDWAAVNDFETVVFSQHPQLKSIKGKLLKLGAGPALMSGSGSTVFGIFASRAARDGAAVRLKHEFGNDRVHPVSLISRGRYRSMWWRQLRNHMEGKAWPPRSRYA